MAVEEETSAGKETDRSIQLILVFVYKDLGRSADTMLIRNSECMNGKIVTIGGDRVVSKPAAAVTGGQSSEHAHERRVVVGGGLRLLVVVPLVFVLVGPAVGGAVPDNVARRPRVAAPRM